MRVVTEPLTAEGFRPFGQVFEAPQAVQRRDWVAGLENRRPDAKPNLAVVRSAVVPLPLRIEVLERHAFSSQAFIPLGACDYLVVVCPDDGNGRPYLPGMRAFVGHGRQGMNYAPGVWHHNMSALRAEADFAMLIWEDGSDDDCEFVRIEEGYEIAAPGQCGDP